MDPLQDHFDDIVVGAGAAGAVIAARLSEDAGRRVLLLEAGEDHASDALTPPALLAPNQPVLTGHNWRIPTHVRQAAPDSAATFDYSMGKVMGGSTAINGALAMRGTAADYDEWAGFSGGFWNAARAGLAFDALESRGDDPATAGHPLPVRAVTMDELTPIQAAFHQACKHAGFPDLDADASSPARGVFLLRKSVRDGMRVSSARSHLSPARVRPNLRLLPQAHVDRLLWGEGARCRGVEAILGGERRLLNAGRVVLCAGALNTPAILMRSGVGEPALLKQAGVATRLGLQGVGRNLTDHAAVALWAAAEPVHCRPGGPSHQAGLRLDGPDRADLHLYMLGATPTDTFPMLRTALGTELGIALSACLMKPRSRGRCWITSNDPMAPPAVLANTLADPADARLMRDGVRQAWALFQSGFLQPFARRVLAWNAALMERDAALDALIATFARPAWHPVGTARMGRSDDPDAVVDAQGRVHGAGHLWIADASIMPTVPAAPTALSCMMLAEEIALALRA